MKTRLDKIQDLTQRLLGDYEGLERESMRNELENLFARASKDSIARWHWRLCVLTQKKPKRKR